MFHFVSLYTASREIKMSRSSRVVTGLSLLLLLGLSSVAQGVSDPAYQAYRERRALFGGNACTLATKYGYPCETHYTNTEDSWTLTLHRIPTGRTHNKTVGVVFFQHGLTDDSSGACLNEPGSSLIWYLADMGYDVWLGNNRGNGISMTNSKYTSNDNGFWDFTWSEMGDYDLPAQINYVIQKTNVPQLTYIGHSEGTIQAFAAFSSNHEIAKKVNVFIALAPVAWVKNVQVLLLQVMAKLRTEALFSLLGLQEFWLPTVVHKLLPGVCWLVPWACEFVLIALSGPFPGLDSRKLSFWLNYEPNPTSVKNMAHWSQGIRDGTFGRFDYGAAGNLQHYGQTLPPQYNLTNWPKTLPVALFPGSKDYLGDPRDVEILTQVLPSPFVHYSTNFGHLDFILGKFTSQIFSPVLNYIQAFNKGWDNQ